MSDPVISAGDLVERLNSHMGKADMGEVLRDCRLAAALILELEAERDAMAKVIDPEDDRPALIARIIMNSVKRQARIYELEAVAKPFADNPDGWTVDTVNALRAALNQDGGKP